MSELYNPELISHADVKDPSHPRFIAVFRSWPYSDLWPYSDHGRLSIWPYSDLGRIQDAFNRSHDLYINGSREENLSLYSTC